jgi:hypothetical protein
MDTLAGGLVPRFKGDGRRVLDRTRNRQRTAAIRFSRILC